MNEQLEFKKLLKSHGYPFLFQVQSRQIRCKFWDGNDHDPHCELCAGTGWVIRYFKRTAIKQNASDVVSHSRLTKPSDIGLVWSPAYVFYLEPGIPLKVGDRIYEVGWRRNKPWGLQGVYEIKHVDLMRGENAKPVYLYVGTMRLSVDVPFHEKLILKLSGGN